MTRLLIRVLRDAGAAPLDLEVVVTADTTVGELAQHLALEHLGIEDSAGTRAAGEHPVAADTADGDDLTLVVHWPAEHAGGPIDPTQTVSRGGPVSGSSVRIVAVENGSTTARATPAPVSLVPVGGTPLRLVYGPNEVDGIGIDVGTAIELCSTASVTATCNGERVHGSTRVGAGDLVGTRDAVAAVRVDGPLEPPPAAGPTLRHAAAPPPPAVGEAAPVTLPEPPGNVRTPGFPVLSAMVPLLMGAGLWFATRSIASAAFVLFSFVFVVASGIETRRESRAEQRFRVQEFHDDVTESLDQLEQLRRTERAELDRASPDGRTCRALADRSDPWIWSVRSDDPAEPVSLVVRVGVAGSGGRHPLVLPSGGRRDLRRALADDVAELHEHDLPVLVDLLDGGLALVGTDEATTDVARSIILQAAAARGPDSLRLDIVARTDRRARWAWTGWLPHDPRSELHVPDLASSRRLVVVDGATDAEVVAALAGSTPTAVLWLATTPVGLPRRLGAVFDLGRAQLRRHLAGGRVETVDDIRPESMCEDDAVPGARRLAPLRPGGSVIDLRAPERNTPSRATPSDVRLDEVLAGHQLALDPDELVRRWRANSATGGLAAPVSRAGAGVVTIDLELDGPHALVAGTTGAGKSELLRTWLCSLALQRPPDRLTFLLIDYKGGAAFRSLVGLPHTVGLVTDLSAELAERALISLRAEVTRRERLLEHSGAGDLAELRRRGANDTPGATGAPPSLVVAVDEFATLANEVPGFVDGLVDIAQRGRSLGIHLVLATQRPAGVVTDHIRANTSLRICLRVADDEESRDVIGGPEAGAISRATPGRAVIRIGSEPSFAAQIAWSGGPPRGERAIRSTPLGERPVRLDAVDPDAGATSELERAVATLRAAAASGGWSPPRRPWLDPLPERLTLADLSNRSEQATHGRVVIGRRDLPEQQCQDDLVIDLDRDGGVLVLGAAGSGRSTALCTIALALGRRTDTPTHIYAIDAGTGLAGLRDTTSVGDVVRSDDIERTTRLVRTVHAELDRRRTGSDDTPPRLVLLVDGIAALDELHERVNQGELFDQLVRIARDGPAVGVHVVVAARRRAEVRPALAAALGCRIDLRFASEDDAAMAGAPLTAAARDRTPGRCVVHGVEAQIALADPTPGDPGATGADHPAPVPRLPDLVDVAELEPAAGGHLVPGAGDHLVPGAGDHPVPGTGGWALPVGLDADTLATVALDLVHHHAIVAGPARSGRSTTLTTIARSVPRRHLLSARPHRSPDEFWTSSWSPAPDRDDDFAGFDRLVDAALHDAAAGLRTVVAVDDLPDLLDGPEEAHVESRLLEVLERSRALPIRVVASGEIDAFSRSYGDLVARLRSARTGVLLRVDADLHGGLVHTTLRARDDLPSGPGRGWLVDPTGARPVQIAMVPR